MVCPICKRPVDEAAKDREGNSLPFCSERCKLIDLGRWLSGKYQIPVTPKDDPDAPPPPIVPTDDDDVF
jgi:endogenous inhibitor of DNA gyrase (YacG/DUF329 family)